MGIFPRRKAQTIEATTGNSTATVGTSLSSISTALVGTSRDRAMEIPTVSRCRDILCSLVGSLPIRAYNQLWNGNDLEDVPVPPEPWMNRPDPRVSRAWLLSWTVDDLLFYGRAYWHVESRYANGFPASFRRLPAVWCSLVAPLFNGNAPVTDITAFYFNGNEIPLSDVVIFYSPTAPVITTGFQAIETARRLERSAQRFASTPMAQGWLQAKGGEQLSADELADLASAWSEARDANAIAALNDFVVWNESSYDPARLQQNESRNYSALDLSRVMNCPPYLVGAPAGTSMVYQNAQQAMSDAVVFGALPFITCIEETLSNDQVTPRGRAVRLDRAAWLAPTPGPVQPMQSSSVPSSSQPSTTGA